MFIFIKSDERGIACSKPTEICIKGVSIVNECSGLVAPTLSESWLPSTEVSLKIRHAYKVEK